MNRSEALEILDRVSERREAMLSELEGWPAEALNTPLSGDGWNAREIVEHLILSERSVCRDLDRLDRLDSAERTLRNRFGSLLVTFILKAGIRVRAPSRSMLPSGDWPLPRLRSEWESNHQKLGAFFGSLAENDFQRAVFRHPVTGPLTIATGIELLEIHLETHRRQLGRLRSELAPMLTSPDER